MLFIYSVFCPLGTLGTTKCASISRKVVIVFSASPGKTCHLPTKSCSEYNVHPCPETMEKTKVSGQKLYRDCDVQGSTEGLKIGWSGIGSMEVKEPVSKAENSVPDFQRRTTFMSSSMDRMNSSGWAFLCTDVCFAVSIL